MNRNCQLNEDEEVNDLMIRMGSVYSMIGKHLTMVKQVTRMYGTDPFYKQRMDSLRLAEITLRRTENVMKNILVEMLQNYDADEDYSDMPPLEPIDSVPNLKPLMGSDPVLQPLLGSIQNPDQKQRKRYRNKRGKKGSSNSSHFE